MSVPDGIHAESERTPKASRAGALYATQRYSTQQQGLPLTSANVDTREDSLVSVGAVINAGLWASGERHDIVRTGERAEIPKYVRAAVWFRDKGRCRLCPPETPLGEWHLDHIKPWSAGGPDTTNNLRVLCAKHNLERSNFIGIEERPEIAATWWCSRCYMADEHHWQYINGIAICPIHTSRMLTIKSACRVERGYWRAYKTAGGFPTWHQRTPGLIELHTDAYCAHCNLRGRTGWTL